MKKEEKSKTAAMFSLKMKKKKRKVLYHLIKCMSDCDSLPFGQIQVFSTVGRFISKLISSACLITVYAVKSGMNNTKSGTHCRNYTYVVTYPQIKNRETHCRNYTYVVTYPQYKDRGTLCRNDA